ncbi:hypothetical protein [Cobetia sp. MC34]|uniref:hypothetical protein n=1 Tax=Cobetia sp. MC34 TaxID=2785080 RepID=UPI001BC96F2F|nr:hypothetical protein [Cobetia sp. MC34]MBS4154780.1 hypothetical protein [Cobetia sp. MC34]
MKNIKQYERGNFIEHYDDYNSAVKCSNIDFILNFISSSIQGDKLILPDPVSGVDCVAARGIVARNYSVIPFYPMSSSEKIPWFIVQGMSFIDAIIHTDNIYVFTQRSIAQRAIDLINKSKFEFDSSINSFSGFYLSCGRPYHYFFDVLFSSYILNNLDKKYNFYYRDIFLNPRLVMNDCSYISERDINEIPGVVVRPVTIGYQFLDEAKENVSEKINTYCSVLKNIPVLKANPTVESSFDIWFGITGSGRQCVNQASLLDITIDKLSVEHSILNIYIDGNTSKEGCYDFNDEDFLVFLDILTKYKNHTHVNIFSLIGLDYYQKIKISKRIDFFVSNGGTGALVPAKICSMAGIVHSNHKIRAFDFASMENVDFIKGVIPREVSNNQSYKISEKEYVSVLESYIVPSDKKIDLFDMRHYIDKRQNAALRFVDEVHLIYPDAYDFLRRKIELLQYQQVYKFLCSDIHADESSLVVDKLKRSFTSIFVCR